LEFGRVIIKYIKMSKKDISYNEAIAEIQQILQEIESEKIDVDSLSVKVKKATELIALCKQKLKIADEEIENLMKSIEK